MTTAPNELVSGPITLYTAPVGTAAPEVSAAPPSPWEVLGTSDGDNISEDGVTVEFDETTEGQRTLGSTGLKKLFRTEEDVMVSCTLLDVSAETYAKVLNDAPVTTVAAAAGTAGVRQFNLLRGLTVRENAILAKGYSPYEADQSAQYWIPRTYIGLSGGPTYQKGEAAGLEVEIMAIEHATGGYGMYMPQDTAPL